MSENTYEEIKSVDHEGNKVVMMIKKPESVEYNRAQEKYLHQFKESLDQGAMLRSKLDDYLREQKIWSDKKEEQFKRMNKDLTILEIKLKSGGIKLSEGKDLYFNIVKSRAEMQKLNSERNSMDVNTAEGQADNARFNSLVCQCVYEKDGETLMFKDFDDYVSKSFTPYAVEAAGKLANIMYGMDENYDRNLVENKFMVDHGFMDEDLHFINNEGDKVDSEGRLVNDKGHYINDNNERIDIFGNPLDEDGEYIVDAQPFLDDDGNTIVKEMKEKVVEEKVETEDNSKKKLKVRKLPA